MPPEPSTTADRDHTVINLIETEPFATEWAIPNETGRPGIAAAAGASSPSAPALD